MIDDPIRSGGGYRGTSFAAAWMAMNGAAAFVLSIWCPLVPSDASDYPSVVYVLGWICAAALLALEVFAFTTAASVIRKVRTRGLRLLAAAALSAVLFFLMLWNVLCWLHRAILVGYLNPLELVLVPYLFDDRIVMYMGANWSAGLIVFVIALLSLYILFLRILFRGSDRPSLPPSMLCFAVVALAALGLAELFTSGSTFGVATIFGTRTIPEARLVSFPFEFTNRSPTRSNPSQFRLAQTYSPASIDRDRLPNVFMVVTEALRRDLVYDSIGSGRFPAFEQAARSGIVFKSASAQATDTDLTFGTILSGTYPHKFRFRDTRSRLAFGSLGLPQLFKQLGYDTAAFVVFNWFSCKVEDQLFSVGSQLGRIGCGQFDLISDPTADGGAVQVEQVARLRFGVPDAGAVDRLKTVPLLDMENLRRFSSWINEDRAAPHFALIYLHSTHSPYAAPPLDADDYMSRADIDSQDYPRSFAPEMKRRYAAAYQYLDTLVAKYQAQIDSLPRSSIMIFTGDHGEAFNERGFILHAAQIMPETIAVPLVINDPENRCLAPQPDALAGHIDIAPTLLDMLGLEAFPGYQGVSLCRAPKPERPLFITSQAMTHEDGILSGGLLLARSHSVGGEILYQLASNKAIDRGSAEWNANAPVLGRKLDEFIERQEEFFDLPDRERAAYYPPSVE